MEALSFKANVAASASLGLPPTCYEVPICEFHVVRMGGGKRTFPGGVNKWQWKRLQLQKHRMREKAWLARERRIYEKRKRAELFAATPVLQEPWAQQRFPPRPLRADAQLSALADRFQKPDGRDLWNDADGPVLGGDESSLDVRKDDGFDGDTEQGEAKQRLFSFLEMRRRNVESASRGPAPLLPEARRWGTRVALPDQKAGDESEKRSRSRGSSHRLWKIEDRRREAK